MNQLEAKMPNKKRSAAVIALVCVSVLLILVAIPYLLLAGARQMQIGSWGVGLVPPNHHFARAGLITVSESVGTGGGTRTLEGGTHITVPPGLVHTQVRQFGRLRWWHTRVVRQPGTFGPKDVDQLQRRVLGRRPGP